MLFNDFAIRVGWAFLMGSAVGLERQIRQRNAGLKTNVLVSIGSAGFTLISCMLAQDGGDPSRMAAQIISGVGFLGGGLILKDGVSVRGLNTAATIWCSAACGTLSGLGFFQESSMLVLFILMVHCLLGPLCYHIARSTTKIYKYSLQIDCLFDVSDQVRKIITNTLIFDKGVKLQSLFYKEGKDDVTVYCDMEAFGEHKALVDQLTSRLHAQVGVSNIGWQKKEITQKEY